MPPCSKNFTYWQCHIIQSIRGLVQLAATSLVRGEDTVLKTKSTGLRCRDLRLSLRALSLQPF